MRMQHADKRKQQAFAICLAAAMALGMGVLYGCSTTAAGEEQLPNSHLNVEGEVDVSHARCGACHPGGTRGNNSYQILAGTQAESLYLGDAAQPNRTTEVQASEGLQYEAQYVEEKGEEGEQ